MSKSIFKTIALTLGLLMTQPVWAKDVIVLVPGFFNSFAREYFSQAVVESFSQKGFQVYVIQNMNAIGTVEDNGSRLEKFLEHIEKIENRHVTFNLVAHSAGGLYSLWVANRQKFEIKNIMTVSTPYKGVDFIQAWRDNLLFFKPITDLALFEGLIQLAPTGVQNLLSKVRISPNTKVFAFGGFQEAGLDLTDAREMSLPLRITKQFIAGRSDGVVGFSSALGLAGIKTFDNKPAQIFRDERYYARLEHWEQVLDYRSLLVLGVRNPSYIQDEQFRFYSGLADLLVTEMKR